MAYFHSRQVKSRGGMKHRLMIRVYAETIEEYKTLKRDFPENVTLNIPSIAGGRYRTKSRLELWVDSSRMDILDQIESFEADQEYLEFLHMRIRDRFWSKTRYYTEEAENWLKTEIKRKAIILLRTQKWIQDLEIPNLQKLYQWIEDFDLGHCNGLKPSRNPSPSDFDKWSRDKHRTDVAPDPIRSNWDDRYEIGTQEERIAIFAEMDQAGDGWRKGLMESKYGTPSEGRQD